MAARVERPVTARTRERRAEGVATGPVNEPEVVEAKPVPVEPPAVVIPMPGPVKPVTAKPVEDFRQDVLKRSQWDGRQLSLF